MARTYRDNQGREISQSQYLDLKAKEAGFPGGRKEREAFRRSVKAGKAPGGTRYKPQAPGQPGGRGRKVTAPAHRAPGKWHPLGSGGRVKTTGSAANILSALKGAARKNESVYLSVKGNVVHKYEVKPSDQGEATLRGYDPQEILDAIQAAGGNVRSGIATLMMREGYDKVDQITSFTIRAYV